MDSPEQDLLSRLQSASASKPTAPSEGSAVEKDLALGDPDAGTPVTLRNLFTHHDAHPVVLDFAMMKAFGVEWLGWDPSTIWVMIQRTFKMPISEHARAKIQTVKTLHVADGPWEQWHVFEKIIQGLNNNIPKFEIMQAPTLEQFYAGIDMLEHIRVHPFADEVKRYMAAAVLHEDVLFVPAPLDFIQMEVSQPYYLCKDCGAQSSALFHDGTCDVCTKKFSPDNGLSMRPDPEILLQGKGKNLELKLTYDPAPAAKRWEEVKDKPFAEVELQENNVDSQVAQLLAARDYTNVRRRQLAEQLTTLKSWMGIS